ncbi:MAG: cyclic nucleotide-binding domain-containing protein [Spirochaetales bacterium]|nr:cyclic nucleotide-binding domain-containing protein [Spirochaetales bacterium]
MNGNINFLSRHALFGGLSQKQLQTLAPLLHEEYFESKEMIIHEGESGDKIYFILEGSVAVFKKRPGSENQIRELATLSKGDTFGEMELIDIQPRAASIKALENTTLLSLSNHDLYHLYKSELETFTMIIMNLAREISRRLRKMDDMITHSLFTDDK